MKTILLSLSLILFSTFTIQANDSPKTFADFYKKYKQIDESFSMNLPTLFFRWALEEEEQELMEGIKNIKLLVVEDIGANQQKLSKDLDSFLPQSVYHDLMIIRDGKDQITLKFRERKENDNELVVLVRDENSLLSICLTGSMNSEDAKKLIKSIDFEQLKEETKLDR